MAGEVNVFEQLRKDVLTCALEPGAAIYEQELAERFGISKSPIREALLRLREQNLVEVRPRSGYRVRSISILDANETYEMRHLYERACVARAIKVASQADIDGLRQHLVGEPSMTMPEWIALNRKFHSGLASICGNKLLETLSNQLSDKIDRLTFMSIRQLHQPPDFTQFLKQHSAIIEAMLQRDKSKALSILKSHIDKSHQRTIGALENAAVVP